jgi:hypothetical protein
MSRRCPATAASGVIGFIVMTAITSRENGFCPGTR